MSIFDQFETDLELEKSGKWFPFGKNKDGSVIRFKLASMSQLTNKPYAKAVQKLLKRSADGDLTQEEDEKESMKIFCETVLVDWENIQETGGKEIKYSTKNAIQLLEKLQRLHIALIEKATNYTNYKEEKAVEDSKN